MSTTAINLVGIAATITGMIVNIPQIIENFRAASVKEIPWSEIILAIVSDILWLVYSIHEKQNLLSISSSLDIVIYIIIGLQKYIFDLKA